ncbi:splicing factor U2AF 35 kDa subunit, putative [Entamoeba invadens IP1]|uniref:Splicing factor U2AF 35 kDa subunit, putative n=1 Tax=Entamoeba invadens IP1 TaxID=370355 RepID=A0A0A1UEP5_ENTIV|nr:splicing factor U2AF 35 kDa subunit, putative [Entamoeba invadens IP1]ELP95030.1 splicing factor U2AF 35 kDa subunit, putative [Entamoeba invadens IP1]|eukprot:XP_004261801.1 splicing factor U2AF 35 kDa subunit, putative [Entamoeba invadens IP1]
MSTDKPQGSDRPNKEKPICDFFFKIGACRHGDSCKKQHFRPESSQTLLFTRMYQNPKIRIDESEGLEKDEKKMRHDFNEFYEDVFSQIQNYGEVEEFIVCGNDNDHMMGNVYVKYTKEEEAKKAKDELTGRYYAGKMLQPSFCRVTDFREAICRQQEQGTCTRGGQCNFIHVIEPDPSLKRGLFANQLSRRKREKEERRRRYENDERRDRSDRDSYRRSRDDRHYRSRSRSDSRERRTHDRYRRERSDSHESRLKRGDSSEKK